MALFGTLEWANKFMEAVNSSKAYEEAAKTWEGDFYYILEPAALSRNLSIIISISGMANAAKLISYQRRKWQNTSRNSYWLRRFQPGAKWQRKSLTPSRPS